MDTQEKIIIYQVFTRLFGNNSLRCKPNGSLEENGCGKMADFTTKALNEIRTLGATHIWYTGIIEHATQTNYTRYGIKPDHPAVVKGKAGSPYAIKDYYDVDPDLATSIPDRMKEFENLVTRSHKAGLKVIIDFVPNHVARQYGSDAKPEGVTDLGEKDDVTKAFSPNNNFYYIPDTKLEGNIDLHRGAAEPYIEFPAKATGNDRFDAWPKTEEACSDSVIDIGIAAEDAVYSPVLLDVSIKGQPNISFSGNRITGVELYKDKKVFIDLRLADTRDYVSLEVKCYENPRQ